MSTELPLVSVIIPHQGGTEILVRCLESLTEGPVYPHLEIILVDNGSSDSSVQEAQRRFPAIRVLRLEENQGYAGGCNRGIEASCGEYVLLLNDDAELGADCLRELVQAAERDPSVGACQPKIRSRYQRSHFEYSGAAGGLMDVYGYPFCRGRLMTHVEADEGQYDDPVEIFWASGVCMLLRRLALEETGPFDEVFFSYVEEIDLCWRMQLLGYRVTYVPSAVVYHIGGWSLDQRVLKRMYFNHRNSLIMLAKNYSATSLLWILPARLLLDLATMLGALLRNPRRARAVARSLVWLVTHIPTVLRLRASVQRRRRVADREIAARLYPGLVPLWYFVFGVRRSGDLPEVTGVLRRRSRLERPPPGEVVRPERRDFLYPYLDRAPIALALMRALECAHLSQLPFERPILDVGCGDGTFAQVLFGGAPVDAGIDADEREVRRAERAGCYGELRAARVEELPFESGHFATVYSNCVLEHVRDVKAALGEIGRVLRPGGRLYLTVPSPRCITFLFWRELLLRLGWRRLAEGYGNLTLRFFRAEHVLEPEGWGKLLERAGFIVEHHEPYMPLRATRIQDLFLPTAVPSLLGKALLGRQLLLPELHRVAVRLYRRRLRPAYEERAAEGSGTLLVARKR